MSGLRIGHAPESVPVCMKFLRRYRFVLCTALLLLAAGALWYATRPFLFGQTKDGIFFAARAEPGMPVVMEYMHSAMRTPIVETLYVDENARGFILKSLRYRTFGAGLPYSAEEGHFRQEDGWFIMDDMNRRFPDISIRNGVINNGTLTVGWTAYHLPDLMPLGTELHLYIAPLYEGYWKQKDIH